MSGSLDGKVRLSISAAIVSDGVAVPERTFNVVTVGWDRRLVERLYDPIAARGAAGFFHVMPPRYVRHEWPDLAGRADLRFFRDRLQQPIGDADPQLLASLERPDLPTVHNMIMGDRIVSKIDPADAMRYATFLARRLIDLYRELRADVIIGSFDALHGGIALAVARHLNIPWFALNFSVIPAGLVCFCDRMSPAARVQLGARPIDELRAHAETALKEFESRKLQAPAYLAPSRPSLSRRLSGLPARLSSTLRTFRRARQREHLQFTEGRARYSVTAAMALLRGRDRARQAIEEVPTLAAPAGSPYVLFGLHFQPESSIDVWAPFFSNQMWVIELLSRSIPASHKLFVKIHKSDVANHSRAQLERMRSFPGVELVRPFADTRRLIEGADLIIGIQGTMGLEAALLGKPVIMLGESPVAMFPSATRVGEITELPQLIRRKLAEPAPERGRIVDAYAAYLAPFMPASHNDWNLELSEQAIERFALCFDALRQHLTVRSATRLPATS